MWSRASDAELEQELEQARRIGLDLLRIFAFIPDFVSGEPGRYLVDAAMLARMQCFAALAKANGISLLPSPLVGHMSGENHDLPGAGERPLYSDAQLVEGARLLVESVAQAMSRSPAVIGYALSNEAPLWGGLHEGKRPPPRDVVEWARTMIAAARGAHPGVPVGLGDGTMDGYPNRELAEHVDFVGPHLYGGDADALRFGHRYDHVLAAAARFGKPLLLEEFGACAAQAGDEEQAALWNECFYAAFTLGARGAIGWCWSDFAPETVGRELPYEHHGFELGFGITRSDGSEKPAAGLITQWRRLLDGLPDAAPSRPVPAAVIVRSSHVDVSYPFSWVDRGACDRAELTALTLASQAGLPPRIVDEDGVPATAQLILLPVIQRLRTSTWLAIEERVHAGATLYWSYFGGDHSFHQGTWCPIVDRLTGCRHRLRYGCFDLPEASLRLDGALADMGPLPTGADRVRNGDLEGANPASYLPIEPVTAQVLAHDAQGRPMLVEHALGKGRVIFSAAPLERYAARLPDGTRRGLCQLYRKVAERAGITDPHGVRALALADAERLCVREVEVGDQRLLVIMNRGVEPVGLPADWKARERWRSGPAGDHVLPKQVIVADR
jgi:endo-1,4-beta-mannosidase